MFRLIFFAVLTLAFTVAIAQSTPNVEIGKNYKLKLSKDDVQDAIWLYGGYKERLKYVDEGTVVRIERLAGITADGGKKDAYYVTYKGHTYFVLPENIGEMTTQKLAGSDKVGLGAIILVLIAVFALICILFPKMPKTAFVNYVAKKRKEYPWFDNYVSNYKDGGLEGFIADKTSEHSIGSALICVAPAAAIFAVVYMFSIIGPLFGFSSGGWGVNNGVFIAVLACTFLFAFWHYQKLPYLVSCPECECPMAWKVVYEERTPISEKVTTTTTGYRDEYGNKSMKPSDLILFGDRKETIVETVYHVIKDYLCENCGKQEREEFDTTERKRDWFNERAVS